MSNSHVKQTTEKNKNTLSLDEQNTVHSSTTTEQNKAHKNWKIKICTYHFDADADAVSGRCLS